MKKPLVLPINKIASWLVALLGLVMLLPPRFESWRFSGLRQISHLVVITLGLLLLYLSFQLYKRKRYALVMVIVVLTVLDILSLIHFRHLWRPLLITGIMALLASAWRSFDVKSDNISLRHGVIAAVSVFGFVFIYTVIGFNFIDVKAFGIDFNLLQASEHALLQIFSVQNFVLPQTVHAKYFLDSINILKLVALILAIMSLFRPIRFILSPTTKADRAVAADIIKNSSQSVEDFFKLWPEDKHYYFNADRTSMLAYKVSRGTALILDGPTGDSRTFKALLSDFADLAVANDWTPAIIHGDEAIRQAAEPLGFKSVFIGNEAVIDMATFAAETSHNKHFRYVHNKAAREGLEFKLWQPPLDANQLAELRRISDAWLQTGGRREYTYAMGYFDDDYLRHCQVAVVSQAGQALAYCNLIPSFVAGAASIDHMRYTAAMPTIGMHFMFSQLILSLHQQGYDKLNLGLAPLSGLEERTDAKLPEKLLSAVKTLGARYYSFSGLEQFKNKFDPDWQPRFIYYRGNPVGLIKISTGLNRALSLPMANRLKQTLAKILIALAALAYVSFWLAPVFGVDNDGLASKLGGLDQPYDWFFDGWDILSGAILIGVAAYGLYRLVSDNDKWRRRMLIALALGGLGGLLAAATPLNESALGGVSQEIRNLPLMTHFLSSALNVGGIYLAIIFYMLARRPARLFDKIMLVAALAIAVVAVTCLIVGYQGNLVQHVQLSILAIWVMMLGAAAIKKSPTAS